MPNVQQALDRSGRLEALRLEHARLERRLQELERQRSLSPAEQLERTKLKKTKLQIKDDIASLEQRHA